MAENLKKIPFPLVGGSYESRSKTFDCSRTVNMFVETHDYGAGKGAQPTALFSCPGLLKKNTIGTGPIRGIYTASTSELAFIVSGSELYQLSAAGGTPVRITGNLDTSTGKVSMVDNGTDLLIVDGVSGYKVSLSTPALVKLNDPNFYAGAKTVTYLGGYFVLENPGTSNFFISDLDSTDFMPLNESSAVTSPDIVTAVFSNNQQLYVLGTRSLEIWYHSGASASAPFSLVQGRTSQIGCTAPGSIARAAGTFIFLGTNDQGDGVVYSMENESPTRVSNHAIETKLQKLGDLSTSTAFALQYEGHYWYFLNLPGSDVTYVYDMTTKQWHERQSKVSGVDSRFLGETHAFLWGEHLIGDYRNGNVYVLQNVFQDNGESMTRKRVTPHSSGSTNIFYKTLQLDVQPGTGTLTESPEILLRISRDGGHTWGNPISAYSGKVGEYLTRVRWNRLGAARDAVFEISVTNNVDITILDAYLDYEIGNR